MVMPISVSGVIQTISWYHSEVEKSSANSTSLSQPLVLLVAILKVALSESSNT